MIVLIDSGVANLASVSAALKRLGIAAIISSDAKTIISADKVIFPGVGSAISAMQQLESKKLLQVLRNLTQPVLGICLGMQLLFTSSEEGHDNALSQGKGLPLLNIIEGPINRLPVTPEMSVPHMGWNQIMRTRGDHWLLEGVPDGSYFYYVHSYAAPEDSYTIARTNYTESFTAVAAYRNFFGCQFHPERSGNAGAQFLKNFLDYI